MKRILLSLLISIATITPAYASTILVFGQSTGLNLFTGDETAGVTVLDANNIPVLISTLDSNAVNIEAFFNLDATSTGVAVNVFGDAWAQSYSGDFQVTSGVGGTGFNYLSGIFDGIQLGIEGGQTFVFGSAGPPLSLVFTSDVLGMSLSAPTAFALGLTNVIPGVAVSNGSFADFTSNVSGNASAVPDGGSAMMLLGMALAGLGCARRKLT